MTTPPQEPVNAAEADPTTQPGDSSDSHGVGTAPDAPVSAQVTDEGDLPDKGDNEVRDAIARDPKLTPEQRGALLNVYDSFVASSGPH